MTMIDPEATVPRRFTRAGDYDLIRKMGSGGFGVVFEARHRQTGLLYAVKRIELSAEDAARYQNEALYPARIASQSLHVLGVHSFFHDPGEDAFYLVTEFVPHGDLRSFLDGNCKPLPLAQALELAIGIAKGLAAIHAQGIIHRDLKPANVLMDRKDERWVPKIADFGLARSEQTVTTGSFATSGYAAPEQVDLLSNQPVGPKSDLFAFGMLFYELLTGQRATPQQDLRDYARWAAAGKLPPPPSAVRAELAKWPQLDSLVAALLDFEHATRLSSAAEVVKTLNQVLRSVEAGPQIAKPEPPPPQPPEDTSDPIGKPPEDIEVTTDAWSRRKTLLVMAGVFALTGSAMTYGLPWLERGKGAEPMVQGLWNLAKVSSAPWYAVASWIVLPSLFGLTIALALRVRPAAVLAVSILSLLAYNVATSMPALVGALVDVAAAGKLAIALMFLSLPLAGAVGALAILGAIARWHRPSRRAVVLTAVAGAIGSVGFLAEINVFGESSRLELAFGFALWQIIVGLVIVNRVLFATSQSVSHSSLKPIGGVVALVLALCAVSAWTRSWPEPLRPGLSEENPKDKSKYVWIPAGEFQMGCSPDDNECTTDEQPAHKVIFTKGFWLGDTEVTVRAWKSVRGHDSLPPPAMWSGLTYNPKWADDSMPIVSLTWQEARDYCRDVDGRLPTEAEWEYAARAGTTGSRYGRLKEIARYVENSSAKAIDTTLMSDEDVNAALVANLNTMYPVNSLSRNPWSLADILGNVAEWVEDDYAENTYSLSSGQRTDPRPHLTGVARVPKIVRGGSFASRPRHVVVSVRHSQPPDQRTPWVGFRCVWDGPAHRK